MWPATHATNEGAVDAIATWIATFRVMDWFVSDQGLHFKNDLFRLLASELKISHHFTTGYSPWANGTIELVCREVMRACKALLHWF